MCVDLNCVLCILIGGGNSEETSHPMSKLTKWWNIVTFWIFGLANNYPYIVMLSAAFDIIHTLSVWQQL